LDDLEGTHKYAVHEFGDEPTARHQRPVEDETSTISIVATEV
ncbi:ABC transporter ATP-binding protein, partial [Mycolicibacterium fortuitum]|nr:ABC transporter ATP-binding protein [Mycolicibacterium fortuitum]